MVKRSRSEERGVWALALALLFSSSAPAAAFETELKLVASDATRGAGFGRTVDIDGDRLVVGANAHASIACATSGCNTAYVFRRVPGGWEEVTHLTPAQPPVAYGYSVSLHADRAVVGSWDFETLGTVHVFERDAGGPEAWGEVAVLFPPGPDTTVFGRAFVHGDTIAVAAQEENIGVVYLYERDAGGPGAWGFVKRLPGTELTFGNIALHGDTLAVGSQAYGPNAGAVFLFEREAGGPDAWGLVNTIEGGGGTGSIGSRAALDGNLLGIGAPSEQVRVHERDAGGPGAWGRIGHLLPTSGAPFESFGFTAVDVWADLAVVGAPDAMDADPEDLLCGSGAAYVFRRDFGGSGRWDLAARLLASDLACGQAFGGAIAVSADEVVVGARLATALTGIEGAVYVFPKRSGLPAPALSLPSLGALAAILALAGVLLHRARRA